MKKTLRFILGLIVAFNLSMSVANAAANEVRVAYFLEFPSTNLEDMQKKNFEKSIGVPVKLKHINKQGRGINEKNNKFYSWMFCSS